MDHIGKVCKLVKRRFRERFMQHPKQRVVGLILRTLLSYEMNYEKWTKWDSFYGSADLNQQWCLENNTHYEYQLTTIFIYWKDQDNSGHRFTNLYMW